MAIRLQFVAGRPVRFLMRFVVQHGALGVVALLALLTCPFLRAADIYKSKDAQGHTVYSDQRPPGPAERVHVDTRAADPEGARARLEAQRVAWAQADAERAQQKQSEREEREAVAQENAKRCREARMTAARFSRDGRQYRLNAQGERVYYSAAEIDQERADARSKIEQFCGPTR